MRRQRKSLLCQTQQMMVTITTETPTMTTEMPTMTMALVTMTTELAMAGTTVIRTIHIQKSTGSTTTSRNHQQ